MRTILFQISVVQNYFKEQTVGLSEPFIWGKTFQRSYMIECKGTIYSSLGENSYVWCKYFIILLQN